MSPVGPHGYGCQPPWATIVRVKPPCATAASQIVAAMAVRPAQKCHNNSGKKKERVGKERGGE
jgi:hypothetical protein